MLVFVYGTLRKDDCRSGVLDNYECVAREAYLEGFQLLHLGSFPGIVPGRGRVRGEVYEIDKRCLKQLDTIEGYRADDPKHSLYRREQVQITTPEGNSIDEVFTYVFNRQREDREASVIESGDWFEARYASRNLSASS